VHEVRQHAERLVDVGGRIEAVDLVEVDPVGLQPAQRVLDGLGDPAPRRAPVVGVRPQRQADLRGQHDVVAPAVDQRLADDLLRLARRVEVGGVEEVDPGVQRAVDDPDGVVVIGVAERAEHHRPEAQRGDGDAGASERSVVHGAPSVQCDNEADRFSASLYRIASPLLRAMTPAARKPRADAERNREKILAAARDAFADPGAEVSMAEVSRRAGVGMATLYRNFPNRRALLEALYTDEVDALCAAAAEPGISFEAWLRRFFAYFTSKWPIAAELLEQTDADDPVFGRNRSRVLAAGAPLLAAAQRDGTVRDDLTLEQALDLVIAVARIHGDAAYVEPILRAALDGLRRPAER
jgi:AcrR family transcriptional regulator